MELSWRNLVISTLIAGFGSLTQALPSWGQGVFVTENYRITITRNCTEGYVSCDDIRYVGVNRHTGASIRLRGRTLHTRCIDGSPCRFLGYSFINQSYEYRVMDEELLIYRSGQLIFQERGRWQH